MNALYALIDVCELRRFYEVVGIIVERQLVIETCCDPDQIPAIHRDLFIGCEDCSRTEPDEPASSEATAIPPGSPRYELRRFGTLVLCPDSGVGHSPLRSPDVFDHGQFHLAYANQIAQAALPITVNEGWVPHSSPVLA
jgi:hypothetical protein